MEERLIIADLEDWRSESAEKGKCVVCHRNFTLISVKESLERKRRIDFFVKKGIISFEKNIQAFLNYDRDFEYEDWVLRKRDKK